ncbi:21475_t:CDS:2, partial [Racocetra persica]
VGFPVSRPYSQVYLDGTCARPREKASVLNRKFAAANIAFKKLFGVEENKDLLISLVNSIVSEEDQVTELTLLNPYNPKNFLQDKLSILDIKAKNKAGKRFNIEIQISDEADYDKRALYY